MGASHRPTSRRGTAVAAHGVLPGQERLFLFAHGMRCGYLLFFKGRRSLRGPNPTIVRSIMSPHSHTMWPDASASAQLHTPPPVASPRHPRSDSGAHRFHVFLHQMLTCPVCHAVPSAMLPPSPAPLPPSPAPLGSDGLCFRDVKEAD